MGFDYIKENFTNIILKINTHYYSNLWKSVDVIQNQKLLNLTISSDKVDTTKLYITSDNVNPKYIYNDEHPVLIINYEYIVDMIYNETIIDNNILYVLKLSSDFLEYLVSNLIKNDETRSRVSKEFNELKRYKVQTGDDFSRYKNCEVIQYRDNEEIQESQDRIVIPKTTKDKYHNVQSDYENRLDLISYEYYGTPRLWWAIASASNVYDPLDIPIGTILRIPPKSEILKYLGGRNVI